MTLHCLVAEAIGLASEHPCITAGHSWRADGGRACPYGGAGSQTVYRCGRCDEYDYGEPGGPGWTDCQAKNCSQEEHMP